MGSCWHFNQKNCVTSLTILGVGVGGGWYVEDKQIEEVAICRLVPLWRDKACRLPISPSSPFQNISTWQIFLSPNQGGGSAREVKKPYCFFEKVFFFQWACRIILVTPKHVLHLVWSPFVIYTAIRTALKEAWEARILGKRRSESKNKKIRFWNGTKCKICFTHLWSYFRKKNRGNFFYP